MKSFILFMSIAFASFNIISMAQDYETALPPSAKIDTLTEKHMKTSLKDPYRWMENSDDASLYDWLHAEELYTDTQTAGALRDQLAKEFTEIYSGKYGSSDRTGIFFQEDQEEQSFNRHRFNIDRNLGTSKNKMSKSPSGRYEVVIEPGNTDICTLQIKDTSIDAYLKDVLTVKWPNIIWSGDEKSFYYLSGRDGRIRGATFVIRKHILGTSQFSDTTLVESKDPKEEIFMFEAGGSVFLFRAGLDSNSITKLDLASGQEEVIVNTSNKAFLFDYPVGKFWFVSFVEQDMGEILSFDIESKTFSKIIAARDVPVDRAVIIGNEIYITYVRNGANELMRFNLSSEISEVIALPEQGSVYVQGLVSGEVQFDIGTCTARPSLYGFNPETGNVRLIQAGKKPDVELDATLVEYTPCKGWKSVMWVVKRKDVSFTSETPMCMYGYGGFSVNILPFYSPLYLPWLRRGGALAIVILPGGMEYGEAWHKLGAGLNKRNVFDAFASSTQTLIDKGWTNPQKTVMEGASNGGLLVAATARYYPKLFRAAIPEVGVQDMARFSLFTCGPTWIGEYGNRDNAVDYKFLASISPYNNIRRGMKYPATIVVTSNQDDRVVPAHSYKFAARLQAAIPPKSRVLLHVAHGAGHNFTKSVSTEENVRTMSIIWAFAMQELSVSQSPLPSGK